MRLEHDIAIMMHAAQRSADLILSVVYSKYLQESRAVAGNPRDAAGIFDP